VDQGRRLERLAGPFLGKSLRRQLPQLVVDQRQELGSRLWVALAHGIQKARYFVHQWLPLTGSR
jgi:hypothetical protein